MRPLFIVGCPRSGTTLLQQILGRHPDIVVPPETAFFTKLLSPWPGRFRRQLERIEADLGIDLGGAGRPSGPDETAALFERVLHAYAERVGRPEARWIGEKTPDHLRHLQTILALFPDARVLSIVRDGRAVALSLSKVPWAPSDVAVCFGIWLESARRQVELHRRPPAALLPVRYEALVREPEVEVRRVARHLELGYDPRLLTPDAEPRGVPDHERDWKGSAHSAIDSARVDAWKREIDAELLGRLERWGGEELAELGYEPTGDAFPSGSSGPGMLTRARRAKWRLRAAGRLLVGRE